MIARVTMALAFALLLAPATTIAVDPQDGTAFAAASTGVDDLSGIQLILLFAVTSALLVAGALMLVAAAGSGSRSGSSLEEIASLIEKDRAP
jgi:hypothetical protein